MCIRDSQDAAGILSYNKNEGRFFQHKNIGNVIDVFTKQDLSKLTGTMSIGHTRYTTIGKGSIDDLQPIILGHPFGLGLAHNGNILNYYQLVRELSGVSNTRFISGNDLELILYLLGQEMATQSGGDLVIKLKHAVFELFKKLNGAYAVVGALADHGMFAFRDPHGIRPLCIGKKSTEDGELSYCLASESVTLNYLGYDFVRNLLPGELVFIDEQCNVQNWVSEKKNRCSTCMFEWVYFAAAESCIDRVAVYQARLELGRKLGVKVRSLINQGVMNPDIVVPVPDTSRTAAISLAEQLALPYREALIKNRYVQRSFIMNNQERREAAVELKLGPVESEIRDKNILLVDDSIVRGTTSKHIVLLLKKYGAKSVTLASTCPPIRFPCFYGIDFPDKQELIAGRMSVREAEEYIGVTRIIYLNIDDLQDAIGQGLCTGCLSGAYPTEQRDGDYFSMKRDKDRHITIMEENL